MQKPCSVIMAGTAPRKQILTCHLSYMPVQGVRPVHVGTLSISGKVLMKYGRSVSLFNFHRQAAENNSTLTDARCIWILVETEFSSNQLLDR